MATETYWCPGLMPWQWFRTCTREVPDPSDQCNATVCTDAKARFADARNRFKGSCYVLKILKAIEKFLTSIVNTPIWKIILLALLAAILIYLGGVGILISLIIGVAIALYVISWLLLPIIGRIGLSFVLLLNQARTDMESALKDIIANCPEHCRGDISAPECQIE